MRYDGLLTAISEADPCGPDLDEIGDDVFLNYTMAAEDRFPDRYYDFKTGRCEPVKNNKAMEIVIDLRKETKVTSELLERSRDLRLLVIEARFQALAGQLDGFADCVETIAGLLEQFWSDVHPRGWEGDFTLRQNTVGVLADRPSVIFPLQNATILRDRRHGTISYRSHAIASGEATVAPELQLLTQGDVAEAIANPENLKAVTDSHRAVVTAIGALKRIRAAFIDHSDFDYLPDLEELQDTLSRIARLIEQHVPALGSADGAGPAGAIEAASTEAGDAADLHAESPDLAALVATRARAPAAAVANQAEARAALTAAEDYFRRFEASSPALILVTQARLLIGQPLVTAVQELAPDYADRAVIRIDPDTAFQIDMNRMRRLMDDLSQTALEAAPEAEPAERSFTAQTRQDAEALLQAVERFHKQTEPSSPVPLLLEKARSFLTQDFKAILKSLLGR